MADLHWSFIAAAYGLTALCLLVEWLLLRSARHQTLARIAREHELEEDTP
jgi:heme exporter protein D